MLLINLFYNIIYINIILHLIFNIYSECVVISPFKQARPRFVLNSVGVDQVWRCNRQEYQSMEVIARIFRLHIISHVRADVRKLSNNRSFVTHKLRRAYEYTNTNTNKLSRRELQCKVWYVIVIEISHRRDSSRRYITRIRL